ncbi:dicarboxylate/amino acid:cation symporter [Faecalicatena orotica]|uniref:dicarboxylate/amino acid:cation symporter n=1 Tax=Faecalicatena orotica TaxID=1544 RepID=UPI003217B1EA
MDLLLSINWTALLVLAIALLLFKVLNYIAYKVNWTLVILSSLVMGAVLGILFSSKDNASLIWLELIGKIYVNIITALVAPVVLVSVISGFISLNNKEKMKSIGLKSVFWLLLSAAAAIALSMFFGIVTGIGKSGGAVFSDISSVTDSTLSSYEGMKTSFDQVLLSLFPANVIGDMASNNVTAIIIIAIAVAVSYVGVASEEGEEKVKGFRDLIEAVKKIIYRILAYVIDLTPYAVLCLVAGSAGKLFSDRTALIQLVLLVALIYFVSFLHTYGFNTILLKFYAKVSPVRFFQKIFDAQAVAFTTQSSVGSLPVTIEGLTKKVGVDEEVANFTAPLGTTIGMPGCTCIWPVLLVLFYVNAAGLDWGVGEYVILAFMTLVLSLGGAGVPGIGVVSAVALFSAMNLPVAAVVLLMPINNISDMARTLVNVTTANVAAAVVARGTDLLDDEIFLTEKQGNK